MNNKIKSIYISNFKAYNDKNIPLVNKNSIFIGENDAGKSSILEALNYFFNEKQIPVEYVRDISKEVIIGIYINNIFYKKVFNGKSFKLDEKKSDNTSTLSTISYIYIGLENNTIDNIIKEFSIAKIKSKIQGELENKINEISKKAV